MSDAPAHQGNEQPTDIRDSTPNSTGPEGAAGGMGVSSERVGRTGPGQIRTDGVRDVSEEGDHGADVLPEQSVGGAEVNPDGVPPKATPPHVNPRDDA